MTRITVAAFLAALLGCGSPTGSGGKTPEERPPEIVSAVLVSGGVGTLTGSGLDQLPAGLMVDGSAVNATHRSSTEIRFQMPQPRRCETAGRPVAIRAGSVAVSAPLVVPGVLALSPAESRILSREEMADLCLVLPAGGSYVVTALNPSLVDDGRSDPLFTVETWTASGAVAPAATITSLGSSSLHVPSGSDSRLQPAAAAGGHRYSEQPVLFDARYETAGEGDTVQWVDFRAPAWYSRNRCGDPKASLPTFGVVVSAVSTTGKTVIGYDVRSAHVTQWATDASRARMRRLADIIESWGLKALREVYGHGYQPPAGAGGRWWHIFRTGVSYPTVDDAGWPRTMCAHYSEVTTTLAPDAPLTDDQQVETLAGQIIHELGHHGEDVYAVRRWGNVFARPTPGWGSVSEAWAQTVAETAARMASGQPSAARYDRARASGVPFADFYATGYGEQPGNSPWGGTTRGPYDAGTRILMFLREQWGDAEIGSPRSRYYAAVMDAERYDFETMAKLVGMTPTVALDRWSLAEATDDLVDTQTAAARGLPQLKSWSPQDAGPLPAVTLGRNANVSRRLVVGRGNYAALYVFEGGADAAIGVSITFRDLGTAPFVARITRLH